MSLLGQELNPESYAIFKADMVVKGRDVDNIALGNTLTDPAFENRTFHYGLSKKTIHPLIQANAGCKYALAA
ncbi:MAG: N-6 DNA methylase [Rothia sp. (in: high G+C Gram-positive bacteria)]|uniref:N-6 DNA methylase n=1 Tax=Rothia sp. (in: high G+C Gram-positive bacteria) TaxID=1885016 RepID=UPI0026FE9807|nr:N-6 DNA methylase [Rothia sp. (in: high G+C Gram-positive bacteria)]